MLDKSFTVTLMRGLLTNFASAIPVPDEFVVRADRMSGHAA